MKVSHPNERSILAALQSGEIRLQAQFLNSSNYTFLCLVAGGTLTLEAVYKPRRGEYPLWDFAAGSLTRREAAAFLVSQALGWELVPPTVYRRRKMPLGEGSLQIFIEHNPEYHYFHFNPEDRQRLRPVALFDLLVNNADRKGGHIFFDAQNHLWLIDHGVCFHIEPKLRTVIWDFAGEPIPEDLQQALAAFGQRLAGDAALQNKLNKLLQPNEIAALAERCQCLLTQGYFSHPTGSRHPYPYPPV